VKQLAAKSVISNADETLRIFIFSYQVHSQFRNKTLSEDHRAIKAYFMFILPNHCLGLFISLLRG
jgi:hypothetical protein